MKTIYNISTLFILLLTLASCSKDDDTNVQPEPEAVLSSISPTSGPKTTIVTINGNHFGTDSSVVQVYFNDMEADVQSVENTKITTAVPARAYTGTVKIVVDGTELEGPEFTYIISEVMVSTYAGSTVGGIDGNITSAKFNRPIDGVFDSQGNLFVVDNENNKIRKITPEGVVSTFAGGTLGDADGNGLNAQFSNPHGIAIDSQDNLYVADLNNSRIRKITPGREVSTFAGSEHGNEDGIGTNAKFKRPFGIAIDSDNNIYVSDRSADNIRKITPEAVVSTFAGGTEGDSDGNGTASQFSGPHGITIDSQDNLYVTDAFNHKIKKITPLAEVTTVAGSTSGFSDGSASVAQFSIPTGIAISHNNTLYVVDYYNQRIRKISTNGIVSTLAGQSTQGTTDGTGTEALFRRPRGICIDTQGDLFVMDSGNHRIRKITQE